MPHKYHGPGNGRKKVKSTIEGKVVEGKRVMRPIPQTLAGNKPGIGSISAYISETRRRKAIDNAKKIAAKERNRRARLAGGFSKAADKGLIKRKRY